MPTAQRLTREEKKAQTRERLIEAAAQVFAAKGFAATSLDEVADAAGLTKGAVYSNFENKEDLVRAVLQASEDRLTGISDTATALPTMEEQQAVAARLFSESLPRERDAFMLFLDYATYAIRNPALYEDFVASHRAALRQVAQLIDDNTPASGPRFKTEVDRAAMVFQVIVHGIALEKLIDPDGVPDDLFDRLMPVLIEAFEAGRV